MVEKSREKIILHSQGDVSITLVRAAVPEKIEVIEPVLCSKGIDYVTQIP
jgi:hypothetical protein